MEYRDNQRGWFYTLSYPAKGFQTVNRRLVASPNFLRAFRNVLPFGMTCKTTDGAEPILLNDFVSGRVSVYVLNTADVAKAEAAILG